MGSAEGQIGWSKGFLEHLRSAHEEGESEALVTWRAAIVTATEEVAVLFGRQYNPRMKPPEPGPNMPTRGNAFSHWLGRASYGLTGWRIIGALPNLPKFVLIVAPHTSNWDFLVGVGALFSLRIKVAYLAKDSLFHQPLAAVLRWLGGIPVDRSTSRDRVTEMIDTFREHAQLILVFTPEGTRKRVTEWRTGFYHVALGANVPIVPVAFDYGKKAVVVGDPFHPTGDVAGDIAKLRAWYRAATPKNQQGWAP